MSERLCHVCGQPTADTEQEAVAPEAVRRARAFFAAVEEVAPGAVARSFRPDAAALQALTAKLQEKK